MERVIILEASSGKRRVHLKLTGAHLSVISTARYTPEQLSGYRQFSLLKRRYSIDVPHGIGLCALTHSFHLLVHILPSTQGDALYRIEPR